MKIAVSSPVVRTPRVVQVESMFDVPAAAKSAREWDVSLEPGEEWNVGLIVGPSGCGKTTIARHLFGDQLVREFDWPAKKALVDGFPAGVSIKDVIGALTSVGFSSPPSWLQPYATLSTGEQFRATLARAILETAKGDSTVIDEFTSTVDRQVAKVGSHALQKAIRREGRKLIAVTCHADVVEWLQPDWIYQPQLGKFTRRCLRQRPPLNLRIHKVDRTVWPLFRDHHYLSREIHQTAQCFGVWVDEELVAFSSYLEYPNPHAPAKKGHRTVVLPDWQGVGIQTALNEWIGEYLWERGYEWRVTFAHPGMIAHSLRSPRWRLIAAPNLRQRLSHGTTSRQGSGMVRRAVDPRRLRTYSFCYVPRDPLARPSGDAAPKPRLRRSAHA